MNTWPKATKEQPCPVCGHDHNCRVAPDRTAAACWHNGNGGKVIQCGKRNGHTGGNLNGTSTYIGAAHRPKPATGGKVFATADDAIAAAGRRTGDGVLAAVWTYPGETYKVARFNLPEGSKEFRPIHRVDDGWRVGDPPGLLPLYWEDEINGDGPIWICEGEKCCDASRQIGLPAITSAHGASSPHKSDWSRVAALAAIIHILADNDDPGELYAFAVAKIILGLNPAAQIRIIRLPGLPVGGDIVDYIEARDSLDSEAIAGSIIALANSLPFIGVADLPEDADAPPPRYTEQSNALTLVRLHGDKFRWHHEKGKYHVYSDDSGRWAEDAIGQVPQWAKAVAAGLWKEIDGREAHRHATLSESARGISAVLKLAQTEPGITVLASQLDASIWFLNCLNGVLDLRTGTLLPHSPSHLLTKLAPVTFNPAAECPMWESFLAKIMAGNADMIAYLQRIAGLLLTGEISVQELFVLWGQGANEKSVWCDTIAGVMGDYAGLAPPALLTTKGNGEHPTEIADLDGTRAIFGSETEEGAQLKIQLVKRLTGDAMLKGRFMRRDYFQFPRRFKLILATNNKPRINENTNAIWRRVRLIPFDVVIPPAEQDPKLLEKLKAEWSGILAWAVRGCLDWQQRGMQTPAEVMIATQEYQSEQDCLSDYVAARCVHPTGENVRVTRSDLFNDYLSWAHQTGEKNPLERNALFDRVRRLSGVSDHQWRPAGQNTPVRGFKGIGISYASSGGTNAT